ncbi:Hsp20/alpha crystallin family protein [Pontiellaceae bacterium B1224]|nr:Hsp20/alpha crystallin family protein [Pontiellaceae bacterium B1224]
MKDKLMPWRKQPLRNEPRWNENPFDVLHREVNELFETYYRGIGGFGRRMAGSAGFEVSETDDEIRVKIELPGMDEKDIEVTLDENNLVIRGEHKEQSEKKKRNYHISEMSSGSFHRSIPLTAEVDVAQAKAKFKRGVLTLTLPKTELAKERGKHIPISID